MRCKKIHLYNDGVSAAHMQITHDTQKYVVYWYVWNSNGRIICKLCSKSKNDRTQISVESEKSERERERQGKIMIIIDLHFDLHFEIFWLFVVFLRHHIDRTFKLYYYFHYNREMQFLESSKGQILLPNESRKI